jgi:diguanylate cyclase (GGDEF)-like protein
MSSEQKTMDRSISDATPPLGEDVLQALFEDALGVPGTAGAPTVTANWAWRLFAFTARLAKTKDPRTLYRLIVREMASAVSADTAAFALYAPGEQRLAIVATHGYHEELVAHVRIDPGEGILGRVFSTGKPIMQSVRPNAGTKARRYRTNSFMAVPLTAADGVMGVVSVTDRSDGQPFDASDFNRLRASAVPAGLALATDRLRQQVQEFEHLASVDPLTGAYNRRHFKERIEQELERQRREGGDLSLLLLDIDDFKKFNDVRGHLHGDRVLRELVEVIRHSVRIVDVCARYGGEEFAVLMPGANSAMAFQIAERIRRNSETHFGSRTTGAYSGGPSPTLSVGVSSARAGLAADALMKEADVALLEAKRSGKNMVRVYGADAREL